jgi:predicted nucleic acid-binding protein
VFHEILYVLCSSRQYRLSHVEAAARIRPLLALRAFHLRQKRLFAQALELFATYNLLDFADAMSIAHVQATKAELISYDTDFDGVPETERSEP